MDVRQFHSRLGDATGELIPSGAVVVCAVSGGVDSIAMLHGLLSVNEIRGRHWTLHVAHLDHGLRAESAVDAAFVGQEAARLGLACAIERMDVGGEARASGRTVEEAGRVARYRFLEEVARRSGAGVVAVAHQADDQAETVLHRIVRGTGLPGLAGMPVSRAISAGSEILLVRPMISFRRVALAAYLASRGIEFCHDATNDDADAAMRNRIRAEVMRVLRERVNPEVADALTRLAEQARRANEVVEIMACEALRHVRVEEANGETRLSAGALTELPAAVQAQIVSMFVERMGVGRREIGFERIEAARELIVGDGRRRMVELPGGARLLRTGRWLIFQTPGAAREAVDASSPSEEPAQ